MTTPSARTLAPIPRSNEQARAVTEVHAAYQSPHRYVFLDAPTGAGKTYIAEMVRGMCGIRNAVYTCTTKTLQDQVAHDFPWSEVLKGKANYPSLTQGYNCDDCTRRKGHLCGKCPDHTTDETVGCHLCHPQSHCPYSKAKATALGSALCVVNTAYLLTEANGPGGLTGQRLITVDEADLLPGLLCGHVSVRVPRRVMKDGPKKVTVPETWAPWLMEALDRIGTEQHEVMSFEGVKKKQASERLSASVKVALDGVLAGDWIYTGDNTFKPIESSGLAHRYLWKHSKKWLLMSATFVSPHQTARELGLEPGEYAVVTMGSTFKASLSPVNVYPAANMRRGKTTDGAAPEVVVPLPMLAAVRTVVDMHPRARVLVHAHSYKRAQAIVEWLDSPRVWTYTEARGRQEAIKGYLEQEGAVLVAPSLERGLDLPDEQCRVQVVVKVPFPDLSDKQVAARLYGTGRNGKEWYATETIRALVQMTGRAVRHEGDSAQTYVLDEAFGSFYRQWERLFPEWWKERLCWGGTWRNQLKGASQ